MSKSCARRNLLLGLLVFTMNLYITAEKCHHTTLWNADLFHVIEVILFPSKWMILNSWRLCRMATNKSTPEAASSKLSKAIVFCNDALFQSFSPLLLYPPRCAGIQPTSQKSSLLWFMVGLEIQLNTSHHDIWVMHYWINVSTALLLIRLHATIKLPFWNFSR